MGVIVKSLKYFDMRPDLPAAFACFRCEVPTPTLHCSFLVLLFLTSSAFKAVHRELLVRCRRHHNKQLIVRNKEQL